MNKRQRRFDRLQRMGCVACLSENIHSQPDIHHIVSNGYRRLSGGDESTIPLCPWHHRGVPPDDMTLADAESHYGPSLALSKRDFVSRYGRENDLLLLVNYLIDKTSKLH